MKSVTENLDTGIFVMPVILVFFIWQCIIHSLIWHCTLHSKEEWYTVCSQGLEFLNILWKEGDTPYFSNFIHELIVMTILVMLRLGNFGCSHIAQATRIMWLHENLYFQPFRTDSCFSFWQMHKQKGQTTWRKLLPLVKELGSGGELLPQEVLD